MSTGMTETAPVVIMDQKVTVMVEIKIAAVTDRTHTVVAGKAEAVFAGGSSNLVAQCLSEVAVAEAVATTVVRVVMVDCGSDKVVEAATMVLRAVAVNCGSSKDFEVATMEVRVVIADCCCGKDVEATTMVLRVVTVDYSNGKDVKPAMMTVRVVTVDCGSGKDVEAVTTAVSRFARATVSSLMWPSRRLR